ncbi:hypothetical protein QYE76_007369 [Lolium multiflorum]|uniref:Uncharacterized protein n=1 Tax=Lolium multiflorum TaxID=4521 RepID=A0AAD8RXM9_LOLMU|nr:hypothetical protein QYE76_007369 [Lolium multiflorum]
MVSSKRLAQMARKWQRMAAMGRKRLTRTRTARAATEFSATSSSSSVAVKGHCVVYTADGARFEVPLAYLGTPIIGELLSMSHDEFGFASDGRITLLCDAAVMEYVLCLLRRNASKEVERALLSSVVRTCHQDSGSEPSMEIRSVAVSSF